MGSERPENCPVDSFQWRTGGSPGKGVATIEVAELGFDSPMLHQITKCRTRKHWRTLCTSDKLKGQLVRLSFKYSWDFARGFVALAETDTDDFDRILGDELDPELDPLAYPNQ